MIDQLKQVIQNWQGDPVDLKKILIEVESLLIQRSVGLYKDNITHVAWSLTLKRPALYAKMDRLKIERPLRGFRNEAFKRWQSKNNQIK